MTTTPKPWWESKTIWLNVLVGVVGVVEASTDVLKPLLPADVVGGLVTAVALANVVLRAVTKTPVATKKSTAESPASNA